MACGCGMADDDRRTERAVREVALVYERIKAQHPLLGLLHCSSPPAATQLLAQSLLGDALRALNIALSVMKQQRPPPPPPPPASAGPVLPMTPRRSVVVKAEPHQLSPPSPAASADSQAAVVTITARRAKKRRASSAMMEQAGKTSSSWVDFTTVPYEDGYEWRKYGEKKINGTSYTRSYFRCTYKDDTGCLATKHVQQQKDDSSDHPLFQVTYNNHHTCSSKGAAAAAMNLIKQQEAPAVLPPNTPVVEAYSAALLGPFHQTPPSPLFPIGMQQQQQPPPPWSCGTATSSPATTTSSCISGGSCDQYYFLDDLEHFLLSDDCSFKIDLLASSSST